MEPAAESARSATEIDNPYWDEFNQSGKGGKARSMRQSLVCRYALSVTSPDALSAIARFAPAEGIVELGAGTGYWRYCLEQMGIAVDAFDNCPVETGDNRYFVRETRQWSNVQIGDVSSVAPYRKRALMMCWPPKDSPMASQALNVFRGNRCIYIGEPRNGRTGDPAFHNRLERQWKLEREVIVPRWDTHNDRVYLYTRKH